jgi:hypothetical protein
MVETEARCDSAVGPFDRTSSSDELLTPREAHAARFDFVLWTFERGRNRRGRELCSGSRRVQIAAPG